MKWYLTDREGKVTVAEAASQYEAVLQQKLPNESEHRAIEESGGVEVDPQPWHLWFKRRNFDGQFQEYVAGFWVYSEQAWKRSGRSA